ncbi:hypothetical protein Y032_0047g1539 [Ancylostoma ceylanicum]|uniref:Uncharacterized protein n=1 Tax=Ancylostoma ceylanicum TaxID=53326 RepID=A0A016UCK3_9BILA|nr:hypothetical protein Y032_0047g1539 [Ancylostoma ceylanicum]
MPSKNVRVNRSKATVVSSSAPEASPVVNQNEVNFSQLSARNLLALIKERNRDPIIETLLQFLEAKIPIKIGERAEAEVRARTIVISGLEEADEDLLPSKQQADVESKVTEILDTLKVQCRRTAVYSIGKLNSSRPRLVKVVLPSSFHWRQALANARFLRTNGFRKVFVRRSMTMEERKHDYDMRQQACELNKGKATREWVVFRGELKRVSELPKKSGNPDFAR